MTKPIAEIEWGSPEFSEPHDTFAGCWLSDVDTDVIGPAPRPRVPLATPVKGVEEVMTAKEAAAYLRLPSVKALYQRVARGSIRPIRLGKRSLRFRKRDLDALLKPMAA